MSNLAQMSYLEELKAMDFDGDPIYNHWKKLQGHDLRVMHGPFEGTVGTLRGIQWRVGHLMVPGEHGITEVFMRYANLEHMCCQPTESEQSDAIAEERGPSFMSQLSRRNDE